MEPVQIHEIMAEMLKKKEDNQDFMISEKLLIYLPQIEDFEINVDST